MKGLKELTLPVRQLIEQEYGRQCVVNRMSAVIFLSVIRSIQDNLL